LHHKNTVVPGLAINNYSLQLAVYVDRSINTLQFCKLKHTGFHLSMMAFNSFIACKVKAKKMITVVSGSPVSVCLIGGLVDLSVPSCLNSLKLRQGQPQE